MPTLISMDRTKIVGMDVRQRRRPRRDRHDQRERRRRHPANHVLIVPDRYRSVNFAGGMLGGMSSSSTRLPWAATLGLAIALGGCARTSEPPETTNTPAPALSLEPLPSPAAGQTTYPQLTTSRRGTILSWIEGETTTPTLKFSEHTASGWSAAQTIASSDNWFLSSADVPTVMRLSDGTLVATVYPAVDPSAEAYDLRLSYSRDEGKTWSGLITPHHDGTKAQHGFASLYEPPDGGLGLVWLDGRGKEDMALFHGRFDSNWKQTAEAAIDTRACECCQTSVAMTSDGPLVAFRDRSPREIRDIHTSLFTDGAWTQPRPVHVDNWRIEACPVNGPAISARDRQVAAAWFMAVDDKPQAWAAFSQDAGRSWGTPIRLDDDTALGHVDIELLDDGSAVATWVEFANDRSQLRMRRVDASGARSAPIVVSDGAAGRVSGYPRLARDGRDLILAWTESAGGEEGGQTVKTASARMK